MDIRDTLSAELPPPRDDEPAGLRQEILDELADHLGCAYHRELLRGANPVEARQRVLNRFGAPAAVARRLWLDAMKGKIMAQRILIATCLMVTLASLSLTGVMWRQSVVAQHESTAMAVEAIHAMTLQNDKAQAGQQEMLKQLRALSEANRKSRSPDWNPVKYKLTENTATGAPVAGCSITIARQPPNANEPPRYRESDAAGIADMGILHPGEYTVSFSQAWGEELLSAQEQLIVEPGSEVDKLIVLPRKSLERVPVRIRCVWPSDLEKEGLVLAAPFEIKPIIESGLTWTVQHQQHSDPAEQISWETDGYRTERLILCGAGMSLAEIFSPMRGLYMWFSRSPIELPRSRIELRASVRAKDIHAIEEPEPKLLWERGRYGLTSLSVLRPVASSNGKGGVRHFQVLFQCGAEDYGGSENHPIRDALPTENDLKTPPFNQNQVNYPGRMGGVLPLRLPPEYWSQLDTKFEARSGPINEWTIPLPDPLIQAVRQRLKAEKS